MSFSFTAWFSTTEADVVAVINKIKADVAVAETDIVKALNWIASEVPNIVAGLQTAVSLASVAGVVTVPELAAADAAVVALKTFAAAQSSSTNPGIVSSAQAVQAGYVAFQQANAAVSAAKASAAGAPVSPTATATAAAVAAAPVVSAPVAPV